MNAVSILAELACMGVRVQAEGGNLRAFGRLTADDLELLRRHKPALLELLAQPEPRQASRPVLHFRLPDHPRNAWATTIGRPGQSRDNLLCELCGRWPLAEELPYNQPRTAE